MVKEASICRKMNEGFTANHSPAMDATVNEVISKARLPIMGLMMIIIMLFHADFGILGSVGSYAIQYGHWGVDAFLFISGFGLYYSFDKQNGGGLLTFYKRRFIRIMPAAIISGQIFYLCGMVHILGIIGLNMWYIRTLIMLYAISPLIYKLLKAYNPTKVVIIWLLVALIGVLLSLCYIKSIPIVKQTISWSFARLSALSIGMYVARMNFSLKNIFQPTYIIISFVCTVAATFLHKQPFAFSGYQHLLTYTLVSLSLPLWLSLLGIVFTYLKRIRITPLFSWIGALSLELYLVHEAIFKKVRLDPTITENKFMIAYGLSFACAIILHVITASGAPPKKTPSPSTSP